MLTATVNDHKAPIRTLSVDVTLTKKKKTILYLVDKVDYSKFTRDLKEDMNLKLNDTISPDLIKITYQNQFNQNLSISFIFY